MSLFDESDPHWSALTHANGAFMTRYPGDRSARQPVHTVYGGAHLFRAHTIARLGELARKSLDTYAPDALALAEGVGFVSLEALDDAERAALAAGYGHDSDALVQARPESRLAHTVYQRVRTKLEREAVEDFRIDFEDGFGARSDEEEDRVAREAATHLAEACKAGSVSPFIGIRIKSLGEEWKRRAARTLELFIDSLLERNAGRLPDGFVVTLPKITVAEQITALVRMLERVEARHGLSSGALKLEMMIEVTQALLAPDGRSPLPGFLDACEGRCVGAHLGTYDYTASCNITAAHQTMEHPMCDLAKGMMLLAYAGTGIFLSDGATNVMPVGRHANPQSLEERAENLRVVQSAWRTSHRHIRHSLRGGYYQGWDLHPAQLPVRYTTCFAFFLEGFDQAAERLSTFIDKAARATLVGDVFDDAATGQGLLNYFLRALNCGAVTLDDVSRTGLNQEELALRSFAKILDARRRRLG